MCASDAKLICTTSRLLIREITSKDAEALFTILGDAEVMRFSLHGPETREGVQKFIDATLKRYARDGFGQWAVEASGELVGTCGISSQMIDGKTEYELGYRFARRHWGKGFATEAALACRDRAKDFALIKLISIIEAENLGSIGVALKVGMALEKKSVFHNIPVHIYGMKIL